MAELHSVDIESVYGAESLSLPSNDKSGGFEIAANVESWLPPAHAVLNMPNIPEELLHEFDLPRFKKEWNRYLSYVSKRPHTFGTRRVFAHNDAQYGNLLRLKDSSESVDEHRQVSKPFGRFGRNHANHIRCIIGSQIIVVDFEYAAPNPAAYDIANHFHEWTANYHCPTPHILEPSRYPTVEERRNFYASYIRHAVIIAEDPVLEDNDLLELMDELDKDVLIWGAASHAGWAIWGIVQAREDVEAGVTEPDFNYFGYAKGRMAAFRKDLKDLGI